MNGLIGMGALPYAVHRSIVVVDVEKFGDQSRTDVHRVAVRDGLFGSLRRSFSRSGVPWERCQCQDCGDGALVLVPADVPKNLLAGPLPRELAAELEHHNATCQRQARVRVRAVLHAGEVRLDDHGAAGAAINLAFRLLESAALRSALADSSEALALMASDWFFQEVIRHDPGSNPAAFRQVPVSVKETETTAWSCLPQPADRGREPDAGTGAAAPGKPTNLDIPRQLPATVADFTGRAAELDTLTRILDEASGGTPGTVVISAIGGTAGIGKTALALHWAHRVASRFPDGQLHVNLRGFDPSGVPMPPADAVRGFLDALGVPPGRIPRSADAQAGLYRSLLADKRMLIVLDNARDEQQVRPLLPASPRTLVLVTSRNQITGLAAAEGARVITLDALTHGEAVQMLTSRLGRGRASKEPDAVSEIAALCAGLPLALSVVAARVTARPSFPLAALAAELRDTAGRLDALDVGDPRASVQVVFSWSYQQLSPQAARMFRLMGLHPGPDIAVDAAARLADTDPADARHQLRELARGCLITEHVPGRYTCHDLLRVYATRQARTIDREPGRTAALGRVLGHYAHAARAAAILLYPSREMIAFACAGQPEDSHPEDTQQARTWLEAERPNLTASIALAAESGFDRHAWQLPWFLATHLARRGYWNERVTLLRTALAAATRLEDTTGQALSSRLLANAYLDLRDHDQALDCYKGSADLYKQLGDGFGEAKAWTGIGTVAAVQGRYSDSLGNFEYVLRLQQELGHKAREAKTLISIAMCRFALGALPEARELGRRTVTLFAELGNRYLEAFGWHGIGYCEQALGDFTEAVVGFRHALDLARKAGDRFLEADVFAHLGDLHHAHGKTPGAQEAWSRALAIFDEIQHPDADQVRAKLANPGPTGSALPSDSPFIRDPAAAGQSPRLPWCSLVHYSLDIKQPASDTVKLRRISG